MPSAPLPHDAAEMFARPNYATITAVRPDGQPVSVATWYLYENGRILVNMDASRRRIVYLRNDPRISLTAMDPRDWHTHISVQGRVSNFSPDEGLVDIDRISRHYDGRPYPIRDRDRVSAWIDIDAWHGWGALKQD
ncbi:pyridoxamine 5'-phosphate oxidase family protein [Nonomuraea sp. NPDC003707]